MASNKIKLGRKNKDINQTQFAKVIGVSKQTVCDWEKGRSVPKYTNLKKIAEYFNTTIDALLEQDNEEKEPPKLPSESSSKK